MRSKYIGAHHVENLSLKITLKHVLYQPGVETVDMNIRISTLICRRPIDLFYVKLHRTLPSLCQPTVQQNNSPG